MNWKKSLFVVMLGGMTIIAMVGCGKTEQVTPATEQTAPTKEQPVSTTEGTRPVPPEGVPSDNISGSRAPAPMMDLAAAAVKLGVTEQQLSEALGELQGPSDLATAAKKLGISEKSLQEALGFSENATRPGGPPPSGSPPAGSGPTGQVK